MILRVASILARHSIAAQATRQILIESARRRTAQKRGGRELIVVAFGDSADETAACDNELIAPIAIAIVRRPMRDGDGKGK